MPGDPVEQVFAYHERTKHYFNRFAASLGYLDWATQPEAFRVFAGATTVPLPFEFGVDAGEPAPLDAEGISDLLYHSLSVSAWKQAGMSRWALRVNPSSGNLHPTEGYLVLPALPGVGERPGVYHYLSRDHVLQRRAVLDDAAFSALTAGLPEGSFLFGLSSVCWREAWKYGERAFRYCQHDTGHAIAAVRIAAALRGWRGRVLLGWSHDAVAAVLGLDREEDFPEEREREEPEVLLAVTPTRLAADPPAPSPDTLALVRASAWEGEADALSDDHTEWEAIDEAARASWSPGGFPAEPAPEGPVVRYSRELIRKRRSAVMFDGQSSIPLDGFARILERTLPGRAPVDALPWSPRIHLALFVHRVDGLTPGMYLLVRDPAALPGLEGAMRDEFKFTRPEGVPEGLPLYLLAEGDVRGLAAKLSCTQEIAGASYFSLGMIADFDRSIRELGAGFYRCLFWEAGAVGQALYLNAEVEGARGTGIGCYFDDPVHEVLGFRDRRYQSLYHFTVGTPVEDERLTTLEAYPTEA